MARFCRFLAQQGQHVLHLFPFRQGFLNGNYGFAQFLPLFPRPFRYAGIGLRQGRADIFRFRCLPLLFFPDACRQMLGHAQGPCPFDVLRHGRFRPLLELLGVFIFVILPVHFLGFVRLQFAQRLLPLWYFMIEGVDLGAANHPAVPFRLKGRFLADGRFYFLNFFIYIAQLIFQVAPALSCVGGKLGDRCQVLHVLHRFLAPFVDIPRRQGHGNLFDLLLRFFNA